MKNNKYYTVGTKEKQKILHCRNKMKNKKITTLSEQNEKQKIPYSLTKMKNKNNTCRNKIKNKKYYTVGTK
jgi:hypothetical protein